MIPLVAPEQLFLPGQASAIEAIVKTMSADEISAGAQAEAASTGGSSNVTSGMPEEGKEDAPIAPKPNRRRKSAKPKQTGSETSGVLIGGAASPERAASEENVSQPESTHRTPPEPDDGSAKAPRGGGMQL